MILFAGLHCFPHDVKGHLVSETGRDPCRMRLVNEVQLTTTAPQHVCFLVNPSQHSLVLFWAIGYFDLTFWQSPRLVRSFPPPPLCQILFFVPSPPPAPF